MHGLSCGWRARPTRPSRWFAALAVTALVGALAIVTLPEAEAMDLNGRIVFDTDPVGSARTDIYSMNPDGTDLTKLTENPGRDSDPEVSPDGQTIVFERVTTGVDVGTQLYLMDIDGGGVVRLTDLHNGAREPTFSPDGKRVAFVRHIHDDITGSRPQEIFVVNLDGTDLQRLTVNGDADVRPTFSPSGEQIAFTRSNKGGVHIMDADGSNQTKLADDQSRNPAFTPDGSRIVYLANLGFGQGNALHIMDADGSNKQRLTDPAELSGFLDLAVSPNGEKIVFRATKDFDRGLFTMNLDGTGLMQLTSGHDDNADWQPISPSPPPDAQIDDGPSEGATIASDATSFAFSSGTPDTVDHFACELVGPADVETADPCTSRHGYDELSDGPHTFTVRAVDKFGDSGAAASRSFVVDTTVPDTVTLIAHPVVLETDQELRTPLTVSATLTDSTDAPVVGETIVFRTPDGEAICDAETNAAGVAMCQGLLPAPDTLRSPLLLATLGLSYEARFDGSAALRSSRDRSPLVRVGPRGGGVDLF